MRLVRFVDFARKLLFWEENDNAFPTKMNLINYRIKGNVTDMIFSQTIPVKNLRPMKSVLMMLGKKLTFSTKRRLVTTRKVKPFKMFLG